MALPIELIRPKRPELATYENRLATFANWPNNHPFTKEECAEAGFFYAGYFDCTRCYYCGGAIRDWEQGDDLQLEHARWFSCCPLVLSTLGKDVVDLVSSMHKNNQEITRISVDNKLEQQQFNKFQDKPREHK